MGKPKGIDWEAVKIDYINDMTAAELAKKYDVSTTMIYNQANKGEWKVLKRMALVNKEAGIVFDQEKRLGRIVEISDKLLDKVEQMIGFVVSAKELRSLVAAVKDLQSIFAPLGIENGTEEQGGVIEIPRRNADE